MIRVPTNRVPTHPGEMLLEEFLIPMNLTRQQLADAVQLPYTLVNEIINQKRDVTPRIALRLEKVFGMSASFWLKLQYRWDLYHVMKAEEKILNTLTSLILPNRPEPLHDNRAII
ncbi:MAG: HigA family addiction module antitoxin [Chloroflexota bacterium]